MRGGHPGIPLPAGPRGAMGEWGGSPQTPRLPAAGQADSGSCPGWVQPHGWGFPAGAGVFVFPQPPLSRRDPAARGRWPSSSPDSVEPCGHSSGAARTRCSRQASPGPPRRRLCWWLLAGPGVLPSSGPAPAYQAGRRGVTPLSPPQGFRSPQPRESSGLTAALPPHVGLVGASPSSMGRCWGWGYHVQPPACSCTLRRLHGDGCEATAASGSRHRGGCGRTRCQTRTRGHAPSAPRR